MLRPAFCFSSWALPILTTLIASLALSRADQCSVRRLYVKRDSLQATMLATRARYAEWLSQQTPVRAGVKLGPWLATDPMPVSGPKQAPIDQQSFDVQAKAKDSQPLFKPRGGWKEGRLIRLSDSSAGAVVTYLTRTLSTPQPATLTVGIGGGDRLTLWLNGRQVLVAETTLPLERYGTSLRVEGDYCNQILVSLDLPAGESRLVVKCFQQSVHRRYPHQFYFSSAPDPIPRFWEQIKSDFPPTRNRLLQEILHDWLDPPGWFAAKDTAFERRFLERAVGETGAEAEPLQQQWTQLAKQSASASDPHWLDLCVSAAELYRSLRDIARTTAATAELYRQFPDNYPDAGLLSGLEDLRGRIVRQAVTALDPAEPATRQLLGELDNLRHRALVAENPLLKGAQLLFVRRYTYDSRHYYDDFYHGVRQLGGNLCVLSMDTGKVREIVPQLEGGVFDRYDLSFDARRLLFGYRRPLPEGFRIWEVNLDGSSLRQLTFPPADEAARVAKNSHYPLVALQSNSSYYGHWTDDMHPCYLPNGQIAFVSSRCEHSVLCGGHTLTCTSLFRMNGDGSEIGRLSDGALSEFTPTMLSDGRILYNRWEYVYKGIAAIQPLWAMRPDGTASEEVYGDNITDPGVFVQARQVPGHDDLIVCTGCGHEPLAVGTILLLDRHKSKRNHEAMTYLTPDTNVKGLRGLYQKRNGRWNAHDVYGPFYCDPYPLGDKFFLISCNPTKRYNDASAYGIYLLDTFGNCVRIYDDPEMSCWQPMLLKLRSRPPVLAPSKPERLAQACEPQATVLMSDVYRGLAGVKRGTVKYLRVMEQIPRSWDATPVGGGDNIPGQQPAVSYHTHIWIAVLLGIVPVEKDGSAYFQVPADRNVFFQALDENFMEIQKMRTFVNFQPGETRSCIGCHEHRIEAPVSRSVLALQHAPLQPGPQPGELAPRPIHYPTDVQPVLDRHCVRCHGAKDPDGKLDLTGTLTSHFSRSYENLIRRGYVNFIQEWTGPRLEHPPEYFTVGGSMAHAPAVPPYTYGSHQSRLIKLLRRGHEDVKLPREDMIKLVTWIDANVPFYGSYFGKRNINYRQHPGFRPEPTLASARGTPPKRATADPIPAELLAWWRLDEGSESQTADAAGHGAKARIVGAQWTPNGKQAGALKFDGTGYLELEGLGKPEAVSIAMWVKVDTLTNRWNPLLFSNHGSDSAFHFSLLDVGVPNVAINTGNRQWVHNGAKTAFAPGAWHHLAVVCDSRFGGTIRFYVDGKRDAEAPLDLGVPLDLNGFRIGGWKSWQNAPSRNFHGTLDDIRIFRGMLTDQEVASWAKG